jgi:cardiolipin synthase
MNIPNFITMIRIILVPIIIIFLIEGRLLAALLIFLIAAAGDGLDGFMARTLNQKTTLGAFLDPLADKLLLTSIYVVMAVQHQAPAWLAVMVVSRDLLIVSGLAILAWNQLFPLIKPTIDSKITTFCQIVTIAYLLGREILPYSEWLAHGLIVLTAILTVFSGIRYIIIGFRIFGNQEKTLIHKVNK